MITAKAIDLIKGAAQDLGVIALGQDFTGGEAEDGLTLLNLIVDAMGIERGLLYAILRTTKTLAAGTASYTIGTGGSIDIARPLWLARAGLIQDTSATYPTEISIDVLTEQQYAEWPRKTEQASHARAVFYDFGFNAVAETDRGTVYPLPIPNVATTQLVLYTPGGQVSQFADLNETEYTFPAGVGLLLRTRLALRLSAMYPSAVVSPELRLQNATLTRQLKSHATRPVYRQNSPLLTGRGYFDQDTSTWR